MVDSSRPEEGQVDDPKTSAVGVSECLRNTCPQKLGMVVTAETPDVPRTVTNEKQ